MSKFLDFKKVLNENLKYITENYTVYRVNLDKNDLWDIYLNAFPEGTNPHYRERTEYDCQCCKQFIRNIGGLVYIKDNKRISIWDITIDNFFQEIANALSKHVDGCTIKEQYFHYEDSVGRNHNFELMDSGESKKWDHFHFDLPTNCVLSKKIIPTKISDLNSNQHVLYRSLNEITVDASETVLELIAQKSLYLGDKYKAIVVTLLDLKNKFDTLSPSEKTNFIWVKSVMLGNASKIKNTAIGTLLVDLSQEMDLEHAVEKFETMVSSGNYKRSSKIVTKSMIAKFEKRVIELGLEDSMERRYAVLDDIPITNVIFADRIIKKQKGVFDSLYESAPDKIKNLDKVEEVSINTFINEIVPKATSLEVMVANSHTSNLVSLIAPANTDSKPLLQWDNDFSWSYNGELADSVKERIKAAGGNVNGIIRVSLDWFNSDDLDLYAYEPNKNRIYYPNSGHTHLSSGILDVDMNANENTNSINPVENIIWTNKNRMQEGIYIIKVNNYKKRDSNNVGFNVELEFEDKIHKFIYTKSVKQCQHIEIVKFSYSKTNGLKIIESLPTITSSKEIWGINTEKFHKVNMVMHSPNFWGDNNIGNKHLFFMLDKCKNDSETRGLYTEFLRSDLHSDRKVFEALGSKLKVKKSDEQLSGLGFSTTQRNTILCKVSGSFNRIIKIKI